MNVDQAAIRRILLKHSAADVDSFAADAITKLRNGMHMIVVSALKRLILLNYSLKDNKFQRNSGFKTVTNRALRETLPFFE